MLITESTKTRERNLLMNLLSEFGYRSIMDFQSKTGLITDGFFGKVSYQALYKILLKPVELKFDDFTKQEFRKNQIVWHHSAGWDNTRGMFNVWKHDKRRNVATSTGVQDDGTLARGFDEKYWAYHIGCKTNDFRKFGIDNKWLELEQKSIGIEVCNAGSLNSDGESWFGYQPPEERIIELDYKGYKLFESVTDEECRTLKYWTLLNGLRWSIPLYYREFDMWEQSRDALTGVSGLYTHNSYRLDKNDISPQPNVIKIAKELPEYYK